MKTNFMLFISVAVMYCTFLCGCHTSKKMDKTIPYEVAERYFVRNDVNGVPPTTITSAKEFEHYFGIATVMGPDGRPTEIDFNKSFVICIALEPTETATDLSVISLTNTNSDQLDLRYEIKRGEKRSYTTQPLLLLIVDKKYERPVIPEAVDK